MNDLWRPSTFDPIALRPLRPRQAKVIEDIRQAVRDGHTRIICQAPTGFGKTLTAAHLIANALEKGKRPMFTCPAIALVNQTLEAFEAEGIHDIGVIQACHERSDWYARVQIASVQTLIRRKLPEVDFVIIDEVHNNFDKLNNIIDGEEWRNKIIIGFTATPWSKGMGLRWTKLIIAATTKELIDEGFLCPFEIFAPADADEADLSKVRTTAGDFNEKDLSEAMDQPKLVADIVKTWLDKGENRSTFLFAVDRAHAASLQEELRRAGVSCGYIDGFSTPEQRTETFKRFRDGEDRIIASVGCLVTGVDEDVRCIIDAAPTKSEIRHCQKIGRGLRIAEGKDKLIILDHAGNTMRLGMVTDIHHETLNTRKPGERDTPSPDDKPAPKPRKCKECGCVMPRGARQCPACGAAMTPQSKVMVADGELVRFGSKAPPAKARVLSLQLWYSGFLGIAQERGKSDGFAAHLYREKFGGWPCGLRKIPCSPPPQVRNFEISRRIAYAKSRKNQGC